MGTRGHEFEVGGLSSKAEASQESRKKSENSEEKKNDNDNITAVIVMSIILR